MNLNTFRPYLVRVAVITAISFVFSLGFNEITFAMTKEPTDRAPTTFTIVIPPGTSARIASGETVELLPEDATFVVGDVLEVKNQDSVSHQLGPIWTPPGTSGRLTVDTATRHSYTCSFSSTQYLGFDVRPAVTISTRLIALFLTVPTLGMLIFLYSLAWRPIKVASNKNVRA
jgi:hypothetical protein